MVTAASWWRMTGHAVWATGRVYAAEQQRRERLRLEAAGRFAAGGGVSEIARDLRVTLGTVRRWRRARAEGGPKALWSRGPVSRERPGP